MECIGWIRAPQQQCAHRHARFASLNRVTAVPPFVVQSRVRVGCTVLFALFPNLSPRALFLHFPR
jgi:hypothetical protein